VRSNALTGNLRNETVGTIILTEKRLAPVLSYNMVLKGKKQEPGFYGERCKTTEGLICGPSARASSQGKRACIKIMRQ
jgi:hypothetical protein